MHVALTHFGLGRPRVRRANACIRWKRTRCWFLYGVVCAVLLGVIGLLLSISFWYTP